MFFTTGILFPKSDGFCTRFFGFLKGFCRLVCEIWRQDFVKDDRLCNIGRRVGTNFVRFIIVAQSDFSETLASELELVSRDW